MANVVTNIDGFRKDISKFVKLTGLRGDQVMRKLALDGFTGVLRKSPVDTGRFRGNWNVGVNKVDLNTTQEGDPGKATGVDMGDAPNGPEAQHAQSQLLTAKWEDEINISNNLPYASALEYGHSKQAPGAHAILGRTIKELVTHMNEAVKAAAKAGG